jgi:hypothetical protein
MSVSEGGDDDDVDDDEDDDDEDDDDEEEVGGPLAKGIDSVDWLPSVQSSTSSVSSPVIDKCTVTF